MVITSARGTSILFGLEREVVEPVKDGRHWGSLMHTLERPDINLIERFLVVEESHLLAVAVCVEQLFVRLEKLLVNDCSKPSFGGIQLF